MSGQFLTGADILQNGTWLPGHGLLLNGHTIKAVLPSHGSVAGEPVVMPPGSLLCPGLVDVQVNGGGGILLNEITTTDGAVAVAAAHRRLGTTAIMPTLITDAPEAMLRAAAAISAVCQTDAGIVGIHLEGPFLSPERPGVHRPGLIRVPGEADIAWLEALASACPGRVLVTLAPEVIQATQLRRLIAAGVVVSAGHSVASFECMQSVLAAGVTGFTHLFNAMPGPSARLPGLATAALLSAESWCGVIADGIHVHPAMLRLLLACKRPDRIMLVSDAMPPAGTAMTRFELQGRTIRRDGGKLTTAEGTLAGADICLADAVRYLVRVLDVAPARALTMASAVPAAFLGLSGRLGHIAPGCRADLLLLTPELDVLGTWVGGAWMGEPGVLAGRRVA